MTIRFRCTQCGKHLKSADHLAGRLARCTVCGTKLIVPFASEAGTEHRGKPEEVEFREPAAAAAAPEPPDEEEEEVSLLSEAAQHSAENLVDMTAMVDIVFFLLIFFLVTSMQGVCASIGMPTPDPQKVSTKGSRTISDFENDAEYLIVRIDQDDTVWVQDQEMPSQQELLVKLRELLDSPKAPRRMLVLGSGDARHATVVQVLDAGNEVGLEDVRLALDEEP